MMDPSLSNSMLMGLLNVTEDFSPCTCRLSSLACLIWSADHLRSCCLWCRCCSLAVALSSHSRHNLSLALSRFIGVELHSEKSSVACVTFSRYGSITQRKALAWLCANLKCTCTFASVCSNFLYMAIRTQTDIHTTHLAMQSH